MIIKHCKQKALKILDGNWGREIGVVVTYLFIHVAAQMLVDSSKNEIIPFISSLLLFPLAVGYTKHVMDLARGKAVGILDIFYYYTTTDSIGIWVVSFLVGLFTLLWSFLFIIPGIIASIAYSMSIYIKIDNPDTSATEVIAKSKRIMEGRKMDFFLLGLSFIGWLILGAVTVVGIVPVVAYMTLAQVIFYEEITSPNEDNTDCCNDTQINLEK